MNKITSDIIIEYLYYCSRFVIKFTTACRFMVITIRRVEEL